MTKRSSKGTVVQLSISSVFVTVAGISKIDEPDDEVQFFDGSSLDTGVGLEDGELTGHVAPGSVSGEGFADPLDSTHQALNDLMATPSKESWKITNPNLSGYSVTFTGTLKTLKRTHAVKEGIKFNFEIKLAGLCTRAP